MRLTPPILSLFSMSVFPIICVVSATQDAHEGTNVLVAAKIYAEWLVRRDLFASHNKKSVNRTYDFALQFNFVSKMQKNICGETRQRIDDVFFRLAKINSFCFFIFGVPSLQISRLGDVRNRSTNDSNCSRCKAQSSPSQCRLREGPSSTS